MKAPEGKRTNEEVPPVTESDYKTYFGKLYKYRFASARHTRSIFEDRELYFAHPGELNDPFEFRPYVNWTESRAEEELRNHLWKGFRNAHPYLGSRRIDAEVDARMVEMADPHYRVSSLWEHTRKRVGVCSLSKVCDSVLQWSYYAEAHKGLCIEFTRTEGVPFSTAFEVQYDNQRPAIDIIDVGDPSSQSARALSDSVLTKAEAWQHEHEVRLLENSSGATAFPQPFLTGVYFGLEMADDMEEQYRELLLKTGFGDVPVYRMNMEFSEYRLTPVQIG